MNISQIAPYLIVVATYVSMTLFATLLPRALKRNLLKGTEKDDPAITAIRGLAVISVLCSHVLDYAGDRRAQAFFASFGVCIFFMVTGYLFYSMVLTGRFNLNNFFHKRVLRVVPAAFVAIAIIQFLDWAEWGFRILDHRELNALLKNFMFGFVGEMYGVTPINDLVSIVRKMGMIWTLKWEWLFYAIFPLAVAIAGKSYIKLSVFTLLLYAVFYPPTDLLVTSTGNLIFLFLIGAGCAVLMRHVRRCGHAVVMLGWVLWLAVVFFYVKTTSVEHLMSGRLDFNLLVTAPFLLLTLCTGLDGRGCLMRLLRLGGVQIMGVISYSFYLYHMTFIYYSQYLLKPYVSEGTMSADIYVWASMIPVGLVVTLISMVSYLYIERRFMIHKAVPRVADISQA